MNILTDFDKQEIIKEYPTSTIEKLSVKYHISSSRIKKILIDNSVEIRVPTKPKILKEWDYKTEVMKRFKKHDGMHYVAISKDRDKKVIDDYLNTSGALTSYINKNLKIEVPTLFKLSKNKQK